MGISGQRRSPAVLPPGKRTVPLIQEAGWARGSVWTDVENFTPTAIRYPGPSNPYRAAVLSRISRPTNIMIKHDGNTVARFITISTQFDRSKCRHWYIHDKKQRNFRECRQYDRGPQSFQTSSSQPKILGITKVTWSSSVLRIHTH
jgi:hypothetical protein